MAYKDKEKNNEYMKKYYKEHPEYRKATIENTKQQRKDNPEQRKEWDKKYNNSEAHREGCKKYRRTKKGKENGEKWNESESHKKAMKKYSQSEAGKECNVRYQTSEKGKMISRLQHIKAKYGLSHKEWKGLWYAQDGRCAICDKFFTETKDICVDHDHETNRIRGLLCMKCNCGIGFFEDNPELTIRATEYLIGDN